MIRALNAHLGIPAESLIRGSSGSFAESLGGSGLLQVPAKRYGEKWRVLGLKPWRCKNCREGRGSHQVARGTRWRVFRGSSGRFAEERRDEAKRQAGQLCPSWLEPPSPTRSGDHPTSGHFNPETLTDKFIQTLVSLSVTNDGLGRRTNTLIRLASPCLPFLISLIRISMGRYS